MLCNSFTFLIPLVVGIGIPASIFVTYGMAVRANHVPAIWPFISDTGTFEPESCVFGLLLNSGAFLSMFIVYFRYRQVELWEATTSISHWTNIVSLWLGLISCFGLNVVANFQVSRVKNIHMLGAFVCFVPGCIYAIIQAVYTWKIEQGKVLFGLRVLSAILSIIGFIGDFVGVSQANKYFKGSEEDKFHWGKNDGGYNFHILSTSMEWILVFSYCFLLGTFIWDFRKITISKPPVAIKGAHERGHGYRNNLSYQLNNTEC